MKYFNLFLAGLHFVFCIMFINYAFESMNKGEYFWMVGEFVMSYWIFGLCIMRYNLFRGIEPKAQE